jgi:hypothetical protein
MAKTHILQLVFFYLALTIYAIFSSPTPDILGWPEILVAILLFFSIRINFDHSINRFLLIVSAYGLSVPVIMAMIYGASLSDILRDVIPFLFLMLPLLYGWVTTYNPRLFLVMVVLAGIIFSIRTCWGYFPILLTPAQWGQGAPLDTLYLANSPEVLFSSLALLSLLFVRFAGEKMILPHQILISLGILISSMIPIVATSLMMSRAGLGAVVLYFVLLSFVMFVRRPIRIGFILSLIGFVGLVVLQPVIETFLQPFLMALYQKTELVGLNSRAQEWGTVINLVSGDIVTFLFGIGWGGRFDNPAVGGLEVNFTHSLISSLLLKSGLVGLIIIFAAVAIPIVRTLKILISNREQSSDRLGILIFIAALAPFLIATLLYASYKSFGFGLILLIFSALSSRKLEIKSPTVS